MPSLSQLPRNISHFLGYRDPSSKPKKPLPLWRLCFWSFLAAWIGIAILEITFTYSKAFQSQHTPMIVASFGATAVLVFGVIESPLAQPRNIICGQIIGAIIGVIIAQLFLGIKSDWVETDPQFVAVQWVGGATAMALSLVVMQLTGTVHPPGGATALIPVVTTNILDLKWFYIGVVAVSAVLQVALACLINNVERRYPLYWWAPKKLPIKVDPVVLSTVVHSPAQNPSSNTYTDMDGEANTINSIESVILDNLTTAEEGRLQPMRSRCSSRKSKSNVDPYDNSEPSVQEFSMNQDMCKQTQKDNVASNTKIPSSTSTSTLAALELEPNSTDNTAIYDALRTLQVQSKSSPIPYCILSPNSNDPVFTITLDLSQEELNVLKSISNKIRSLEGLNNS